MLYQTITRARPPRGGLAVLLAACCLLAASCASSPPKQMRLDAAWLQMQQRQATAAKQQSAPGPGARELAQRILAQEQGDMARMELALTALVSEFAYDPAYARRQFTRSAQELYRSRLLGGCSDYALAGLALFRAMGYPSMLVTTLSSKWLERRRENPLAVGYGHSFIEVMVDGRWHLADPNHFVLYGDYAPAEPFYPHKELFMARGWDFHDLGLRSTADARAMLERHARLPQPSYREPSMRKVLKVELDLPALFVGLGNILAGSNDFLALKRYARAQEFDPDYAPAYLARARLHLQAGRCGQALQDLERAASLQPRNQTARDLLRQARRALTGDGAPCDAAAGVGQETK